MNIVRLRKKGQLTLAAEVRRSANLEAGDVLEVEVSEQGDIVLRPRKLVSASQAWFWTESWQDGEREASSERDAGLGGIFRSGEQFLDPLRLGTEQ